MKNVTVETLEGAVCKLILAVKPVIICSSLLLFAYLSHQQKVRLGQGVYGLTKDEMLRNYADVFEGLGELEDDYYIEMDPNVKLVINPPRRVPVAIRDELKMTG
jgi:hypothetical protein